MTTQSFESPAVQVEDLTKRYRDVLAVDAVSLSVGAGETLGILGANGAGKTTTVEMIAGLRRPDGGSVSVMGMDPTRDRARVRQVLGVQLQEGYLHGALTVNELLTLYRSFYPDPRPHAELLDLVELTSKADERFEKLSGGQRQRVSVALALAGRPRVLILDELTTGLDPEARRGMLDLVRGLRDDGTTVLLVSHHMDEVEKLCDRAVVLEAGRVVAANTPAGLAADAGLAPDAGLEEAYLTLTGGTR